MTAISSARDIPGSNTGSDKPKLDHPIVAWVLTLPCAIALSASLFFIFSHIF